MRRSALLIHDAAGAAVTLAVAGLGVWFGLARPQTSSAHIGALRDELAQVQATLAVAQGALRTQQASVVQLAAQLEQRGALPERSPVESDLRVITRLAEQNQVQVNDLAPLGSRDYPGMSELKYALTAAGDHAGLLRFLHDFEASGVWADITLLRMSDNAGPADGAHNRSMYVVVSLYAVKNQPGAARGPGKA